MQKKKETTTKGILFLIPSPLGNLNDVSKRVIETISLVDEIYCEDTRNTKKLLNLLSLNKKLYSCHEHNEKETSFLIINKLNNGLNIGYLSDAGNPGISDPGEILVKECIKNNIKVIPILGGSAFLSALIASSLDTDHFLFYGFLPSKKNERIKEIKNLSSFPYTICFYESPFRINETILDLYETLGNRKITIARELTKIHEEFIYTTLKEYLSENKELKGEIVLLLEGNKQTKEIDEKEIIDKYKSLLSLGLSKKDAIISLASILNLNKNYLKKLLM